HPTALHSHHCLHALNLEGEVRLIENVARGDQQVRRHQKGGGPSLGWLSASSTVPVSWWSGWESMVVVPSGSRRHRWPVGVVHSKAPGVVWVRWKSPCVLTWWSRPHSGARLVMLVGPPRVG